MSTHYQLYLDARRACIHEAGHWLATKVLGGHSHIRVGPRADVGPIPDYYNLFYGTCHIFVMPPTAKARRLIGLAGMVAEVLDQYWRELDVGPSQYHDFDPWVIDDLFYNDLVSDLDLELCGGDYEEEDVVECFALLLEHWQELEQEARWHMGHCIEEAA